MAERSNYSTLRSAQATGSLATCLAEAIPALNPMRTAAPKPTTTVAGVTDTVGK